MVEPTLRAAAHADVLDCLEDAARREAVDSIFLDVSERLSSALPHILEPTEASTRFRARIEQQPWYAHSIDYNQEALEFNKSFFLKNLLKCLLIATYASAAMRSRPLNVVDIGAGAGTFSIAWQLLRPHDNVLLVDTSDRQLSLAACFAEALRLRNRRSLCRSFPAEVAAGYRLRLASYWFCEQNLATLLVDEDLFQQIIGPGTIIVDHSAVIDRIFLAFPRTHDVLGRWRITVPLAPDLARLIGEGYLRAHGIHVKPARDR